MDTSIDAVADSSGKGTLIGIGTIPPGCGGVVGGDNNGVRVESCESSFDGYLDGVAVEDSEHGVVVPVAVEIVNSTVFCPM